VQIVSQPMEAELGYCTAVSSGRYGGPGKPVLAWDSGGGSFQVV
jgi:exopolyphosphatase/pppGpp-phosphohydrolase